MRLRAPRWGRILTGLVGMLACSAERLDSAEPGGSEGGGAATSAGASGAPGVAGQVSQGGTTLAPQPTAGEGGAAGAATSSIDFISSESGTRLKARVLTSDDGLQIPYDVFDTELGVPCQPRAFADGVWRCLPAAYWRVQYADEECKEPIVLSLLGGQSPIPGMIAVTRDLPCTIPDDEQLYLIGDELPRPATAYAFYEGQACSGNATAEYQRAFAVTPLDLADLVRLTIDEAAVGSRLAAPVWVGDDGSRTYVDRQGSGLHDVERETTVDLGAINPYDADSAWRLLPATRVGSPACTKEPCNFGSGVGGGGSPADAKRLPASSLRR